MKRLFVAFALMPLMTMATTWYVNGTSGSDSYSGKGQSLAKKTIQAAVDSSSNDDIILVAAGTYAPFDTGKKKLTIESQEGALKTIVDGNGTARCAVLGTEEATRSAMLIGFTLTNGKDTASDHYGDGAAACCGTIVNCIIMNCVAQRSIVFAADARNCLFHSNNATSGFGVLTHGYAYNCTVVDNKGKSAWDNALDNCIVNGNSDGVYISSGNMEAYCYSSVFDHSVPAGSGNIVADPKFIDPMNGDYRLASDSPCIDGGDNSYVSDDTDLDGNARIVNDVVDVGCYEYRSAPITWYVNANTGSDANSGRSQTSAKKTIQAAVDSSSNDDIILVAAGTYAPFDTGKKKLTIESQEGALKTIVDGNGTARCAVLGTEEATRSAMLIGFTLTNGKDTASDHYGDGAAACCGTIVNCIIMNCVAQRSIVFAADARNCLFHSNNATSGFGVLTHGYAYNCTVVDNKGKSAWDNALDNCIVNGNSDGVYISSGNTEAYCYNSVFDHSVPTGSGNVTADPKFVDSANGDYRLASGSPCIDAGNNLYVVNDTDLDGKARIVNDVVDIGCYEYVGSVEPIVRTVTFDSNGGTCTTTTRQVSDCAAVGELPTATRLNYDFMGWFTAAVGGGQVFSETVVTADVTYFAQWKAQESEVPTYGPWGEGEDVTNPDKLGPTCLQDMTLTINGASGTQGDVVAVYRTDTDALCGLGKVLDDSGTLTLMCYASTGTKLHFKVWIVTSGVTDPTILDCDAKCDLIAPTSGSFYAGHALVVSDDKELTLSLKSEDWHTVSFNVVSDDSSPVAVFADVADKIAAVTQGVNYWMPGKAGTLKQIEVGKGYWVKTTSENVSWTVSGKTNPSVEITLTTGWNLIGYAPEGEEMVASVLKTALAEKAIDYVTHGVSFYPNGTLTTMMPGKAYWVHATKAYTLVYDHVSKAKLMMAFATPKFAANAATPTYGPFGESEDVANPDKLGPTMFTDVTLTVDGKVAAVGDCVAVYRGDTGALCGLGKVLDTPGAMTIVCYAAQDTMLTFKVWTAASGLDNPMILTCGKVAAPASGEIVEETLSLVASTAIPAYTVIVGSACSIDLGLKGYTVKGLPTGLKYDTKKGVVTGKIKKVAEDVTVTFSKEGEADVMITFIIRAENNPTIDGEGFDGTTLTLGVTGGATGIPIGIDAESGIKSVAAKNLPPGMKIASSKDKKSWYITGAPTKAGSYEVEITLISAAGNKVTEKFTVTVSALPSGSTGTFTGFVQKVSAGEDETLNAGSFQVTVSDVGKIAAKIVTAAGTYSFTATGWDSVNEGIYSVKMTTKRDDVLTLACDSHAAWNAHQLTGSFTAAGATVLSVKAQKNAFGKQWFFNATGDDANGWTLSFAENAKAAALTVTLNADGKTSVVGKLGANKITASGYADVSGIATGVIFADFAPVVNIGKTKKILSLRANLWFDKKNDHDDGVGSAVLVQ